MSPSKQALAGRSARTSPASTSVSAPTPDPLQQLNDLADFKTETEQAIKDLQDVTNWQGKKLADQGTLLVKYQRLEIRVLKEDGRKAICKLLKDALEDPPSAKVATVALLMKHVQHRMRYEAAAVSHFGDRRHRQLRWRTFMKRQQAYSAVCRAISAGSQDTVVAYGDASFSSSCNKGNPSTPTVSLRRNLGYHCKVFDTDEFRTSRLCCACKSPMDGMPLPVTGNFLPYANAAPFLLCLTTFGHEGLI